MCGEGAGGGVFKAFARARLLGGDLKELPENSWAWVGFNDGVEAEMGEACEGQ